MSPASKTTRSTTKTMKATTLRRVKLGDNRELRVQRIPTGMGEDLIRVGVNLLPGGDNLSGAVFPESYLDDVIMALRGVHGA